MPWTFLDTIEWLTAPTEREKAQVWQRSHPDQTQLQYTNCPDIKAFWQTPLGRIYLDSYLFWSWLKRILDNPERTVEKWRWQWSWFWRGVWTGFTSKYISNPNQHDGTYRPAIAQDASNSLSEYFISPSGKLLHRRWRENTGSQDLYSVLASSDLYSLGNQEVRERRSVQRCTDRPSESEPIEVEVL